MSGRRAVAATPTSGAFAVLTEIGLFADALVGFGLGGVVGTAVVVFRECRGDRAVRATYTVGLWSLVGCVAGTLLYLFVEVA